MLRSENVRDDEMVGEAGDGLAHVSIALARSRWRVSFHNKHRTRRHRGPGVACAPLCVVRGLFLGFGFR